METASSTVLPSTLISVEMLADLVMAAANEALRAASKEKEEKMDTISGGLNIPGMF